MAGMTEKAKKKNEMSAKKEIMGERRRNEGKKSGRVSEKEEEREKWLE